MAKKANARRYAQAIFDIALEQKTPEQWQANLQKIAAAVSDGTFQAILDSPKIRIEDKSRVLKQRLPDISPLALNLVLLLVSKTGVSMIKEIDDEYKHLLDSYKGIETADITTAVPLDDKDTRKLAEKLSTLVDAKVELKTRVEPQILGGVIARVGGKLLDGSTRSKLAALKKELVGRG